MTDLPSFDPAGPLPEGRVVLEASAGTGKTWSIAALVTRYVAEAGIPIDEILVVTFTRAATSELRDRVRSRLSTTARILTSGGTGGPFDDQLLNGLLRVRGDCSSDEPATVDPENPPDEPHEADPDADSEHNSAAQAQARADKGHEYEGDYGHDYDDPSPAARVRRGRTIAQARECLDDLLPLETAGRITWASWTLHQLYRSS